MFVCLSVGAVIYTGRETRSSMNTSIPPNKINSLFLLFVCMFVCLYVCFLFVCMSVGAVIYTGRETRSSKNRLLTQ